MEFSILLFCISFINLAAAYEEDYCISLPVESLKKHITREYQTPDGRKVLILDGIVQEERSILLRTYMTINDHWRFVGFDEHFSESDVRYDGANGIPWKSWQDPALLSTTKIGFTFKNIVQTTDKLVTGSNSTNFDMNEIYTAVIRRGDRTLPHAELNKGERGYSIAIYNNVVWRKNHYGELLFYDEDDEIFGIVRPKFGRVVIWDSTITYMSRPPSMNQILGQNILFAHFSADEKRNREKRERYRLLLADIKLAQNRPFVASENIESVMNKDVAPHMSLFRQNYKGYKVAVYDDLFPKEDLDAIRSWTIKYGRYFSEDDLDISSDNVHWIAGLSVDKFVQSRFWPIVSKMAAQVSGEKDWYPYDVACNLIRTTDHTRYHLDTSHRGEKEMTFLMYLSPNWTAADYGETAFMQKNNDADDNEYVAEVVPRYGRAVIFDGDFPHSARPPSVMHYGPRYTLAVKLSENKWEAVKKTFSEESRHEPALVSALQQAKQAAENKRYFIASHKIQGVVQYHRITNVQKILSKTPGSQGGDDEDEEQRGEEEDGPPRKKKLSRSDREMYENFAGEDPSGAGDLPYESQKLIVKMIKHHLSDMQSEGNDQEMESEESADIPEYEKYHQVFNPERRQRLFKAWTKVSNGNADELNGYLELMLQQQAWLRSEVEYRMLGLL